jgi:hypothetical protein
VIPEDCEAGLTYSWPASPTLQGFAFQGRVETLVARVVVAVADGAYRVGDAEFRTESGELARDVLRAMLGVEDGAVQAGEGGDRGEGRHGVGDAPHVDGEAEQFVRVATGPD